MYFILCVRLVKKKVVRWHVSRTKWIQLKNNSNLLINNDEKTYVTTANTISSVCRGCTFREMLWQLLRLCLLFGILQSTSIKLEQNNISIFNNIVPALLSVLSSSLTTHIKKKERKGLKNIQFTYIIERRDLINKVVLMV